MAPPMKPSREEMLAVTMNQKLAKQGAKTRKLAEARDVNTMPDPKTYAAVMGLLGERPDEMGFSVAHPKYKEIMDVADPAFALGTAAQVVPLVKPAGQAVRGAAKALAPKAGQMVMDAAQATGMPVYGLGVVKPKGGNWLAETDDRIKRMTPYPDLSKSIAVSKARIASAENAGASPRSLEMMKADLLALERDQAVNNWTTRNLGNYIKKEIGTPDDPVRKLAEEGIVHAPHGDYIDVDSGSALAAKRSGLGFPAEGMGKSPEAKAWEELSDFAIKDAQAKNIQGADEGYRMYQAAKAKADDIYADINEKFDEMAKSTLPPGEAIQQMVRLPFKNKAKTLGREGEYEAAMQEATKIFQQSNAGKTEMLEANPWVSKLDPEERLYTGYFGDLGFDHIIDVLREDVRAGRIRPEQLSKVSMEQAVRRTYEYDLEMAKKMGQAGLTSMEGFPVHKQYPGGYKWIELRKPENRPEGWETSSVEGMWTDPSGRLVPDPNIARLEEALKYEGDTMGHCVGGYCPDVVSGRSRIYSLRDAKGEPHVTVEVQPSATLTPEKRAAQIESLMHRMRGEGMSEEAAMRQVEKLYPESETFSRIVQIKGKQNRAPNEQYLPYVQDFVKGGQWSDVGDLQNTGLIPIDPASDLAKTLKTKGLPVPKYVAPNELTDLLKQAEVGSYTNPTKGETFINPNHPDWLDPPPEGMKDGGYVKMGVGGLLGKAAKAAKTAKGAENVVVPAAPTIVIPSKISNVKEAIRESKGDFGARRVERAADEIPNLEKLYKEEALRQAFGGDNARAVMTMNPADFEKYAKGLSKRTKADIGPKMAELAKKGEIDKHTLTTDEYIQYLRGLTQGFDDVPFLSIDKEEFGLPLKPFISGHEGRHRSRALAESGQPTSLVRLFPSAELREPLPRRSQEEYIQALRDELELTGNLVLPEGRTGPAVVLPDIYAKGGEVKMGKGGNPSKKKAIDDFWAGMKEAVPPANDLGPLDTLKQNLSAAYEGAKKIPGNLYNLATDPAGYVKNLPAPTGQQIMDAFGPGNVGAGFMGSYRPHTPLKPDPEVGTRYKVQDMGGLAPRKELDIEKIQGSQAKIFPWDATHRNKLVTEVSEVPLTKPVLTEGGDEYMLDVNHIKNRIAGASNKLIANRILNRIDQAAFENLNLGGTGKVYGFPSRMGDRAEYAATFPTDIAYDLLKQANLNKKELKALDASMRNMVFEGKPGIFKNMAPFGSPEFEYQLRHGLAPNKEKNIKGFTDMNMRKAFMDRMSLVGNQKLLGFNIEDLTGSVLSEPLKGLPKGYVGNVAAELDPGAPLRPSKSSTYSHDFAGQYAGSMANMPVEFLMPNRYELIYREMKKEYPDASQNALRNMTIGAMEKRSNNISEMIGQRSIDAVKTYQEGLKKGEFNPNNIQEVYDYMRRKKLELKLKSGGAVQTKSGLLKVKRKK